MTRKRHDVGLGEVREEVGAGLRHHSGRNACNAPSTEQRESKSTASPVKSIDSICATNSP